MIFKNTWKESPSVKYSEKEIENKLWLEFKNLDRLKNNYIKNPDAIVIFAAEETGIVGENKQRIEAGLKVIKSLAYKPFCIFLGTEIHNENLKRYLKNKGRFRIDYIKSIDNATTKDQILDLAKLLSESRFGNLLIVSHTYHIPRIRRYCNFYLPKHIRLSFLPFGGIADQKTAVELEIKKIIEYAALGDLPLFI